ncbi:hypothetical protein BH10PAT1_BH10PAT1_1610 [soil metagenome]
MNKKIVAISILIMWPLSLFLANTPKDFLNYVFPFFQPKLVLVPFLFLLFNFKKSRILLLIISFLLIVFSWKPFYGQTVFTPDYEKSQQTLQKSNLYNSVILARIFQNKIRIPMDKISSNLFALTDTNNYFFGFAPGQIKIDNQNLNKFPFLSLPFLLIGFYFVNKNKHKKLIITFLLASLINLSVLTNFDRNDFILWISLSSIIIYGLNIFDQKFKYKNYYYLVFILFSFIEISKLFLN